MSHISYPESHMNVAVDVGSNTLKVYGWEDGGFRKHLRTIPCADRAQVLNYIRDFNAAERRALATRASGRG